MTGETLRAIDGRRRTSLGVVLSLVELPESGHCSNIDQPAAVVHDLFEFLG
jgi:hypothetical protein